MLQTSGALRRQSACDIWEIWWKHPSYRDGFKGFPEAIEAVYPKSQVHLCIVHQIRSSLKCVPQKDKKAVVADMQPIYKANSQEYGYQKLLEFEEKWGKK